MRVLLFVIGVLLLCILSLVVFAPLLGRYDYAITGVIAAIAGTTIMGVILTGERAPWYVLTPVSLFAGAAIGLFWPAAIIGLFVFLTVPIGSNEADDA